ncbi:PRD domain-containing protein [Schaalia sp. 19OD2882]|uniref:PRD domain-containing protein n=1 Tax=Schaalia sp. 19OD2882 TaxID=2794089 RepID=UPI001C1EAF0D|nr:PRD domain-containing protein [Schaalia sp. 19OD2882]QWW19917.1 PRD domain-containing protein [Schaalia sp. 19OD2882]
MTEERAHEVAHTYRVTHALNNNAVAAVADGSDIPTILVGKGIGFGRKAGDRITPDLVQEQYVAVGPDHMQYVNLLSSISPDLLAAISGGLELAEEQLGNLHPSVYLMLTDHLAFAVARLREGETIENPLLAEISARFPREFVAAEVLLRHVNSRLGLDLPIDEAAFVTLHLRAASTGAPVKQPLSQANALADLAETVRRRLVGPSSPIDETSRRELTAHLARLADRAGKAELRANAAFMSIRRDLHDEYEQAEAILELLVGDQNTPVALKNGEAAHTAVFLHGWRQDLARRNP